MARHASALKAARQAVKRNEKNRQARAKVKTVLKNFRTALTAKRADKDEAKKTLFPLLNELQRTLMKAANKKLLRPEAASRQISRLSAAVYKAIA